MTIHFRDNALIPIWRKIERGQRLTLDDGLVMYKTRDLISLGKMAHAVQQRKSGDAVYFVLNQKIEHTNICVLSCKFCDFATKKGAADAYEMTTEEIAEIFFEIFGVVVVEFGVVALAKLFPAFHAMAEPCAQFR